MLRALVTATLTLVLARGCDLPRDPERTLERVRGGTLRVGVIERHPWAIVGAKNREQGIQGVEGALVQGFARELGATVQWIPGPEGHLLQSLEEHQLDLVIGGLTRPSPWEQRLGFTRPYYESRVVVGVPRSAAPPQSLRGVRVGVEPGTPTGAEVEKRGGIPVSTDPLSSFPGPVASPEHELARWGFQPTELELTRHEHVLAVPPGENGWLVHLERYLERRKPTIGTLLQEAMR